jgi:hypothetical protein
MSRGGSSPVSPNFPAPVENMGSVQKLTPRYLAEQARLKGPAKQLIGPLCTQWGTDVYRMFSGKAAPTKAIWGG